MAANAGASVDTSASVQSTDTCNISQTVSQTVSEESDCQTDNVVSFVSTETTDTSKEDTLSTVKPTTSGEDCTMQITGNNVTVSGLEKMESRLMTVLNQMNAKIEMRTKEMRTEFDQRLTKVETVLNKVAENSKKLIDVENSVNFAHKEIVDQKHKTAKLENETKELREKLNNCQKELKLMKGAVSEELNLIERRSRSYSIRILGVPANKSRQMDDHRKFVAEILHKNGLVPAEMGVSDVARSMEKAHPLGKPVGDKVNYTARFFARPDRDDVLRRARGNRELQDAERVVEDLTKTDLQQKKLARPLMDKAWREGKRVRFQKGKLFIEGREVAIPKE